MKGDNRKDTSRKRMGPALVRNPESERSNRLGSRQGFTVCMAPDEFLKTAFKQACDPATTPFGFKRREGPIPARCNTESFPKSSEKVQRILRNKMKRRELIPTPEFEIRNCFTPVEDDLPIQPADRANIKFKLDKKGCMVFGHEGRNRSLIAKKLGIKSIPVRIDAHPLKNWPALPHIEDNPKLQKEVLRFLGIKASPCEIKL